VKVVIIVQARMTSTRLPGKILKTALGKPLLEYQIERLQRVTSIDDIIIATTNKATDDVIIDLCDRLDINVFRGDEHDVLSRYYGAAQQSFADVIVRVTSDCPLIDPVIIDSVINFYVNYHPQYDYVANCLERTFPRGMDTEVFSIKALKNAHTHASKLMEREHVTPYITRNPGLFTCANIAHEKDASHHRWTVDTPEDFELIQNILEGIYPHNPYFTMQDILNFLAEHPTLFFINAHVEQKHV